MSHIYVTDLDGSERRLDAVEGWRVMEIIREHGLPIRADCGGSCECATCHVYVADVWLPRLYPAREDELGALDQSFVVEDNSRLSCQLLFSPELAGLKVTLAPD
jgi:2Fe-2S ferredoxin